MTEEVDKRRLSGISKEKKRPRGLNNLNGVFINGWRDCPQHTSGKQPGPLVGYRVSKGKKSPQLGGAKERSSGGLGQEGWVPVCRCRRQQFTIWPLTFSSGTSFTQDSLVLKVFLGMPS